MDLERKRKIWRDWYHKNKHDQNKKIYFSRSLRKVKAASWLKEYKKTLKCSICEESHYATLDFHHTDPKTKSFTIGGCLHKTLSITRLQKEIDKCKILCANCHRKFHFNERELAQSD